MTEIIETDKNANETAEDATVVKYDVKRKSAANLTRSLENAVSQVLADSAIEVGAQQLMPQLKQYAEEFIRSEYGPRKETVLLHDPVSNQDKKIEGVLHEQFKTVLAFVRMNEPVFLCGPAGAGKNVMCEQVAQALSLPFYFTNAVTQEFKLTGFTDAVGKYHETAFYKAFKNGGLFMLDEIDASIPEVLVILNAAIANKEFDFPAPIGNVKASENFRVIAAGNTYGTGATYEYVGRNQLDAASLDRFAMVKVGYDQHIEMNCASDNQELVDFVHRYRAACDKAGYKTVVSYRGIKRLATMSAVLPIKETVRTCLIKGMEKEDLRMVLTNMKGTTVWDAALTELGSE